MTALERAHQRAQVIREFGELAATGHDDSDDSDSDVRFRTLLGLLDEVARKQKRVWAAEREEVHEHAVNESNAVLRALQVDVPSLLREWYLEAIHLSQESHRAQHSFSEALSSTGVVCFSASFHDGILDFCTTTPAGRSARICLDQQSVTLSLPVAASLVLNLTMSLTQWIKTNLWSALDDCHC